jgi:signal transduction histidine kinase
MMVTVAVLLFAVSLTMSVAYHLNLRKDSHKWVQAALPLLDQVRVREQYLLFSELDAQHEVGLIASAQLSIRGYLLQDCPKDCRLLWNTSDQGRQRELLLTPLTDANRWLYQRLVHHLWYAQDSDVEQLRQKLEALYPVTLINMSTPEWRDTNGVKLPVPSLGIGLIWHYSPYITWMQWLGIISLGLGILLIGVYWLSHEFDARLQALVQATSRLAHGQLKTRVRLTPGDLFSSLGESFNRMAQHIQRLIEVQREMIRAVSHELRTPVARVRFGLQMIEDYLDDDYVLEQVKAIDGDIQELDELVDEILTYARLEEGGPVLEFKLVNIEDLLDQIVRETLRRNPKVAVWKDRVEGMGDPVAEIEQRYLHRAIQNLVGNACRYAKAQVCINFYCAEDLCRIEVEDDGAGIPEEDWERVFSPFARLDDSRTRASGGYGLGLSIVRRVAYWHGGRASLDRSRWGGAKFSIIWPRYHQSGISLN